MTTQEKGCCEWCEDTCGEDHGCRNSSCPCHSPASWEEEFDERFGVINEDTIPFSEQYSANDFKSFIRTKLAEQKAAIVKALPSEREKHDCWDDGFCSSCQKDDQWNAYRKAALKVIQEI